MALFLAADVGFRRILGLGRSPHRSIAALLALATIPLGTEVAAVAQLAALVVILAVALAGEGTARRRCSTCARAGPSAQARATAR